MSWVIKAINEEPWERTCQLDTTFRTSGFSWFRAEQAVSLQGKVWQEAVCWSSPASALITLSYQTTSILEHMQIQSFCFFWLLHVRSDCPALFFLSDHSQCLCRITTVSWFFHLFFLFLSMLSFLHVSQFKLFFLYFDSFLLFYAFFLFFPWLSCFFL